MLHNCYALVSRIKGLLEQLSSYTLTDVHRKINQLVDGLVKFGLIVPSNISIFYVAHSFISLATVEL